MHGVKYVCVYVCVHVYVCVRGVCALHMCICALCMCVRWEGGGVERREEIAWGVPIKDIHHHLPDGEVDR